MSDFRCDAITGHSKECIEQQLINMRYTTTNNEVFITEWNKITKSVHRIAKDKGWWDGDERNNGEMIALIHSEASEALEVLRKYPLAESDKIDALAIEEELADIVIRVMDMAAGRGWNVGEAIVKKVAHNEGRAYRHGKKF